MHPGVTSCHQDAVSYTHLDVYKRQVYDYAGYMSVGYDSAKVPAPTALADLLKAEYKGKVALNGDPTKAGAAFAGVQMVSIGQGGTAADIACLLYTSRCV